MGRRSNQKTAGALVLWLRVGGIAVAALGVALVCRVMTALSSPVDFALAIGAALVFAQRFEQ